MDFDEALENMKSAKSKVVQADKKITVTKSKLAKAKEAIPEAYEKMTDVMAEAEAETGDVDDETVGNAQAEYESAKDAVETAKTELKVAQKVLPKRREQYQQAKKEFQEIAYPKYMDEAEEVIQQFAAAFAQLEKAQEKQNELWKEIEKNQLEGSHYMPTKIEEIEIKLDHLRRTFTPEKWLEHAAEKNDNFTTNDND